jgi:hypothetical protein
MLNYIGDQPNLNNGPFAPLAQANASSLSNNHQPRPTPFIAMTDQQRKNASSIARQRL